MSFPLAWLGPGGILLLLPALLLAAWPCRAISISVYIAAPNTVSSPATGGTAVNENFSSNPNWLAGTYTTDRTRSIGTFDLSPANALQIVNYNQYGGAGNSGRYGAIGAQSGTSGAITLNLASPTTFFGMWWSAIDPYNGVSLYDNNTFLMRISGGDMIALFNASNTLTAQNGTQYQRTAYLGKPGTNPRQNTGEYYAYTMFYASGLTFNRVVLDNSGTTSTGFEFDNFQTRSGTFQIPGSTVLLTQYQITAVPEPSVWIPAGLGLAGAAWWRKRRRSGRNAAPPDSGAATG
jgi:hypothetical protein